MPVETVNFVLGLGTIGLQIVTVALIAAYLTRSSSTLSSRIVGLAGDHALWVSFLASAAGIAFTLYYSEVVGYIPCGICWMTRVFFYPQAFLFALAWWKKDAGIADYSLVLAIPGALLALYKHYLELGGSELLPCPASGAGSCAKRYIFEFDYVTMPLMGFTLLAFLIILMRIVRSRRTSTVGR